MVEDENRLVIIHHAQVISKIIRPPDLDTADSLHAESIERFFKLDTVMSSSSRGRKMIVYKFTKIALFPFEVPPFTVFMLHLTDSDHEEKAGSEIY